MRRHRLAAFSVVVLAAVAAATLSAASAAERAPASAQAAAGSIALAIGSEPTTLDPQLKDDGGERAVTRNIYETLMARTTNGQLVPGLAARAPTRVNAKTWQVKLRTGIKFTNGEPLNADAVVFSIKRIINPKFASEQSSFVQIFLPVTLLYFISAYAINRLAKVIEWYVRVPGILGAK